MYIDKISCRQNAKDGMYPGQCEMVQRVRRRERGDIPYVGLVTTTGLIQSVCKCVVESSGC